MAGNTLGPLTFGFDIGIASVGWCVLGESRIVDLGVRCFDKAETDVKGESLNLARRTARLTRRRLRRRAWRLTKLARLLKRSGVIGDTDFFRRPHSAAPSPWELRVAGLDRRLEADEWARVLYHLCKHRGFHWISKAQKKKAEGDKKEGGRVTQGLSDTERYMRELDTRSVANMVLAKFPDTQRNKLGNYDKALARVLLGDELKLLFEHQRALGNLHATPEIEATILGDGSRKNGLFWEQVPMKSVLSMLGHCTFEKSEYRAPKASFTAERHVLLTRINNLRIVADGVTRPLNGDERRVALALPYEYADARIDYKRLRTALKKIGQTNFQFAGVPEDKEKEMLVKLPAWEAMSKALKAKGLETEWQSIAGAATGGDPTLLDEIARVLSVFKDGDEVEAELRKLGLPGGEAMIDVLGELSFDKFHNLSLKALRRIVPQMEAGLRYDEAVAAIPEYGHHSKKKEDDAEKDILLPPLYSHRDKDGRMVFNERLDVPRNPVVLRALNQARKVLNALVRRYGSPSAVHVEMARDLSRPLDERNKVKKAQEEYRERNDKDKAAFADEFGMPAKSREFEKFQLYREQQGKCAYSLAALDLDRVLRDTGYAEVDHALPYSRSFDDSKNNKVLVLAEENRNKGNRTPYEYLDGASDSPRWRAFVAFVESTPYRLAKRQRLLRKDFGGKAAEEFRERNLNDTRYICRFFKNWVEDNLKLAEGSAAKRCVVLNGQTTAFLRARWGLVKLRCASDRHHALDAAVVAACSHAMVKRLGDYARRKELEQVRAGFVDTETGEIVDPAMYRQLERHFPDPWPSFRQELDARLHLDDAEELRAKMATLGRYEESALEVLRPVFVSRAPQRRNSGAAHKETIYGQPEALKEAGKVVQHVDLVNLTRRHFGYLEDYILEKRRHTLTRKEASQLFTKYADPEDAVWQEHKQAECLLLDPLRNKEFYEALYSRLEANDWNGKKAFSDGFRKPTRRTHAKLSPPVRKIAVLETCSGIPVRGGIAKNDTMLRVDVFRHKKDGKFHLVPIYVHHAAIWKRTGELPNRAIVAFKDEDEWTVINDNFDFQFSLHPNDLVRITQKSGEAVFGYYRGCHSGTGAVNVALHDRFAYGEKTTSHALWKKNPEKSLPNDKLGLIEGIGVKVAASVEKFHVDVLGNLYPAPKEERRGLA